MSGSGGRERTRERDKVRGGSYLCVEFADRRMFGRDSPLPQKIVTRKRAQVNVSCRIEDDGHQRVNHRHSPGHRHLACRWSERALSGGREGGRKGKEGGRGGRGRECVCRTKSRGARQQVAGLLDGVVFRWCRKEGRGKGR